MLRGGGLVENGAQRRNRFVRIAVETSTPSHCVEMFSDGPRERIGGASILMQFRADHGRSPALSANLARKRRPFA
jgi:hypothetical protein